jgi:hypothetical protein
MLSVYLDTFEQAIAFQVSDLSPKITDFIKNIGGTFRASNGWKVEIGEYTELDIVRRTIFLPNKENSQNPLRVDRKWDLCSNFMRDVYIDKANLALQELVDAESMPGPKFALEIKPWRPNPMPKIAGGNHSNKPLIRQ